MTSQPSNWKFINLANEPPTNDPAMPTIASGDLLRDPTGENADDQHAEKPNPRHRAELALGLPWVPPQYCCRKLLSMNIRLAGPSKNSFW